MSSSLNDFTFAHNNDVVRIENGRQSMSNNDSCAVPCNAIKCCLHNVLTCHVECAGSFVKDQDLGLANDSSGNGDPLALTTAEMETSVADRRRVTLLPLATTT